MATNGITGQAADDIVVSITSFALYGFPESHAASFALLVYASAYLKAHFPAAFYTALLNNQPMGFYSPATLVKDAQRHGVRFAPIDVQISNWNCFVQEDGTIRLGLRFVRGLRDQAGKRIEEQASGKRPQAAGRDLWPEALGPGPDLRFRSMDELVARAGLRQDELRTLAEVGALASLGGDRRSAFWQAERAGRPAGPLLMDTDTDQALGDRSQAPGLGADVDGPRLPGALGPGPDRVSPLPAMTLSDRVRADYDGTGLTIGPHPMAFLRASLATRGVQRARDLLNARAGRRVRVAGAVLVRQRPGTAKGFVFLSLEDETGIANIIVTPDVFGVYKRTIVDEPYLLVEGVLQNQDGAVSVKVDRVDALRHSGPDVESHDFY
jgi:error-prone DNA polymerase